MFNEEEDKEITKKLPNLPKQNELEYKQFCYDEALKNMLNHPTIENINAFTSANKTLYETQDLYRIGKRILISFWSSKVAASRGLHGL